MSGLWDNLFLCIHLTEGRVLCEILWKFHTFSTDGWGIPVTSCPTHSILYVTVLLSLFGFSKIVCHQDDVVARRHHFRESLCRNEKHGRGSDPCPLRLLELGHLCPWWRTRSLRGLRNRPHSGSLAKILVGRVGLCQRLSRHSLSILISCLDGSTLGSNCTPAHSVLPNPWGKHEEPASDCLAPGVPTILWQNLWICRPATRLQLKTLRSDTGFSVVRWLNAIQC